MELKEGYVFKAREGLRAFLLVFFQVKLLPSSRVRAARHGSIGQACHVEIQFDFSR